MLIFFTYSVLSKGSHTSWRTATLSYDWLSPGPGDLELSICPFTLEVSDDENSLRQTYIHPEGYSSIVESYYVEIACGR